MADGIHQAGGIPLNLPVVSLGETLVRPRPGMLILFPSHAYHRTFAHGTDGSRICMAFDLWPQ